MAPGLTLMLAAAFYLVLIDTLDLPELYAGAGAVCLATLTVAIGHETGASGVSVAPRWLAGTWRALARVPADVALVSLEIVAQAVRPGRPRGTLRALPFAFGGPESSRDVGRRALAEGLGSLAPNTIVIGIDPERDLLLAHQLRRRGAAEEIDVLGLR